MSAVRSGRPGRVTLGDDAGFTLVELLMSIVILAIVAAPLTAVVVGFLANTDTTAARMNESHDAQLSAAYFAQDVQSIGARDHSDVSKLDAPLKPSVEQDVAWNGGTFPCGTAGLPAATIRFGWDEWNPGTGVPTLVRVAYVKDGRELRRLVCRGSSTPVGDVVVAHNVTAVTADCVTASGGTSCTGAGAEVPTTVNLHLTLRDAKSAADYPITLTGQRRQS